MSPRLLDTYRQTRVHRIGGSGVMPWGIGCLRGCGSRRHELEKAEHHQHQESLVHSFGLGASGVLAQFSQPEVSGACPPLGTHCRLEHSLQKSPG
jgi:hypothetical protein